MQCSNCGTNNPTATAFCQHCGMPFASSVTSYPSALPAQNGPPLASSAPGPSPSLSPPRTRQRVGCLRALGCLVLSLGLCGILWGGITLWGMFGGSLSQSTYTMEGAGEITSVAWSPDNTRIAAAEIIGSEERSVVQVWNARTGDRFFTFTALNNVRALAWSPNGQQMAIVGRIANESEQPSAVQIIDATTGKQMVTLRFPNVFDVAWSPDSNDIVAAVSDGEGTGLAQVWDARKGTRVFVENIGQGEATTVAWSPNGKQIAAGGADGTVKVWDALTGNHLFAYPGHLQEKSVGSRKIVALAWAPDNQWVASADENTEDATDESTVQVWQPVPGGHTFTYPIDARSVAWSPDSTRLVTTNEQIRVWDALTGDHMFYRPGDIDSGELFPAVAWSSDGTYIASGNFDGEIDVWQPPNKSAFVGHTYYFELIKVALITLLVSVLCLAGAFFFTPNTSALLSASGLSRIRTALTARLQSRQSAMQAPRAKPYSFRLILLALLVLCLGIIVIVGMISFGWNINWWTRT